VRWALDKRLDVEVTGREVMDLSVRADDNGTAIVLHNLNNPMMMKGPIRAVFPAGPQVVSLAIPEGRQFAGAKLLVAGRDAHTRLADGRVEIDVPRLDTLEVVHVNWG